MRSAGIIATAVSAICSSVLVVVDAGTEQTQSPTENIVRPGGQPSTPFPTFDIFVSIQSLGLRGTGVQRIEG